MHACRLGRPQPSVAPLLLPCPDSQRLQEQGRPTATSIVDGDSSGPELEGCFKLFLITTELIMIFQTSLIESCDHQCYDDCDQFDALFPRICLSRSFLLVRTFNVQIQRNSQVSGLSSRYWYNFGIIFLDNTTLKFLADFSRRSSAETWRYYCHFYLWTGSKGCQTGGIKKKKKSPSCCPFSTILGLGHACRMASASVSPDSAPPPVSNSRLRQLHV
jgi:hypothetical protein